MSLKTIINNKLIRTGSIFTVSSMAVSIATMLSGLLMIRWLEPAEIGKWQALSIIQAYLPFLQLGVQSGLNRDLPILLGKGEKNKGYELISTAKYFAIMLSLFFIVITIIAVIILGLMGKHISLILGISTIGFMAAGFSYQNHLIVTFRSAQSFDKLSIVYFVYGFLLLLMLPLIYRFHYYGILLYYSGSSLSLAILTHFSRPFKEIKPKFNASDFIDLVKSGLVLMSFNQIRAAANSIPRILVLKLGGTTMLGLYSPALAIGGLFNLLPSSIAQFFHPQMGYKYGQTGNARDLWEPVKRTFWLLMLACIPISVTLWFATPYLLEYIFPKYMDSLWPMRIMALAFVFSGGFTTHGILYSIKAYKYAYIYSGFELFGFLFFPSLFVYFGSNILIDVTLGILVNNILLSLLNYLFLRHVLFLPAFNQKEFL